MRYEIEVERKGCTACGVCYLSDPSHFESDATGKSRVAGGSSNGLSVGSFDDSMMGDAEVVASSCPASVILVTRTY
ncbi:MAG TPA: ferredoxin [Candidatus Bathyarchaeia archaeon]|nr:ferredoxin [Candidatus Bathyarchaeia archaeon]